MKPQDKWSKKNGFISKSYKLNIKDVEHFSEACKLKGVSQASALTKFMRGFYEPVLHSESDTE